MIWIVAAVGIMLFGLTAVWIWRLRNIVERLGRVHEGVVDLPEAEDLKRIVVSMMSWRELRWKIAVVALVDVVFTLVVALGNTAIITQNQCRGISRIAGAQSAATAGSAGEASQILKKPYIALDVRDRAGRVIGEVQMPVFGLPPSELRALSAQGAGRQRQQLRALQALANSDCSTI